MRIELFLATMESDVKLVIDKLDARQVPTDEEIYLLAEFISFLHLRRPVEIKESEKTVYEWAEKALREMPAHINEISVKEYDSEVGGKMTREHLQTMQNNSRNYALSRMFPQSRKLAKSLFSKSWLFMQPELEDDCYIACDNPVVIIRPGSESVNADFLDPATHIVVPLSKKTCLHMAPSASKVTRLQSAWVTTQKVEIFNIRTAIQADIFIIGQTHQQLEKIVQLAKEKIKAVRQ